MFQFRGKSQPVVIAYCRLIRSLWVAKCLKLTQSWHFSTFIYLIVVQILAFLYHSPIGVCWLAGLVGLVHLLAIVDGVLMVSFNVSSFCFIDADTFSSLAFVLHSMCFNRLIFFSLIYCFQFFLFFGKSIYCPLWHNIFSLVSDNFIVIVENRI